MAVDAVVGESVTVNPTKVRYSFSLDHLGGTTRGQLCLQRSDKREDGTWMDDPHVGSRKTVPMIIGPAVDGIVALLPVLLPMLGVSDTYTDFRLRAQGNLSVTGVLDVSLVIQVRINAWIAKTIPSLGAFLTVNPTMAAQVLTAWGNLDAAINAANQEEKWL
jgi:hypothetical protein